MCLFSVVYRRIPGCPVFVFANREESPDRPSSPPGIWESSHSQERWLGGIDLKAGGTWLGINRAGVIAAVTNRRKSRTPPDPKSRGLLCRELLEQGSIENAEAEFRRQWASQQFAGFNLILLSAERGLVLSATEELDVEPISPGFHAITNGDWDDPHDRRIARVRKLTREFNQSKAAIDDWILHAKAICGLGEDTGGDAVCFSCPTGWGTVSSSIIALAAHPQESRYFHAAGSPAVTAYEDHSHELQWLLQSPA